MMKYILEKIQSNGANVLAVDGLSLAEQAGSAKAVNVVLIGVLSRVMGLEEAVWHNALKEVVPAKFLEMNKTAFALGRKVL